MTHAPRAALLLAVLAFASPAGFAGDPAAAPASPGAPARANADEQLLKLLEEDLTAKRRADPISASSRGDRRFDRLLPDESAEGRAALLADARARLAMVEKINCDDLSPANRTNWALIRYDLQRRIERDKYREWQLAINQIDGLQNTLPQMPDQISFTSAQSLDDYLARLRAVPAYVDQTIANMREGVREKRVPPRVVMLGAVDQCLAQGEARYEKDPASHLMFKPFVGRDAKLADDAKRVIGAEVVPAFRRLGEFLRDEYIPACRESTACADFPEGREYYDFLIRGFTTLELSAAQIHEVGVKEVARIRAEMMETIARSDYPRKNELKGDELFRAFVEYLRTEPRFYFTEPEDLLNGYRAIAKVIDADMPRLFGKLPRLPYGIREMPSFIAPSSPTAYYYNGSLENGVAGYFIANTWRLDQRPKYEMVPLTLHEAVPGHHHQIALAQELMESGLPEWRTTVGYTVFVEGWGLYAESLGLEMGDTPSPAGLGLYADPYDNFGRHSYEMWRAMRLVVDTGMHALGWSRERAIQFMLDNSALTRTNIEREVDRYIAWPGQAVAYKIGELHIKMLRKKAETALGEKFDVRGFHDAVLGQGAVPLNELTRQVEEWMAARAN